MVLFLVIQDAVYIRTISTRVNDTSQSASNDLPGSRSTGSSIARLNFGHKDWCAKIGLCVSIAMRLETEADIRQPKTTYRL